MSDDARQCGEEFDSSTPMLRTNCGKIYLTMMFNKDDGTLFHVLVSAGKVGGCMSTQLSSFILLVNDMLEYHEVGSRLHRYSLFLKSSCAAVGPDCCIAMIARILFNTEEAIARERDFT